MKHLFRILIGIAGILVAISFLKLVFYLKLEMILSIFAIIFVSYTLGMILDMIFFSGKKQDNNNDQIS